MQTIVGRLRNLFGQRRRSSFFGNFHENALAEDKFRRAAGYALSYVVSFLVVLTILLNWFDGNLDVVVVLCGVQLSIIIALFWLWANEKNVYGPLALLLGTLAVLGVYLVVSESSPEGSLYWHMLYPSMLMLCLGLRRGTVCFFIFFALLLLAFATPLHFKLPEPLSWQIRLRFMIAVLGAFAYSWCAEFFRFRTQHKLGQTMHRLERDSLTDPLTGLGNRRDFHNYCKWLYEEFGEKPMPFSLAIADLDHFKKVNDNYGHEVGDKVLRHVAKLLGAQIRASDRLFRWGGEEFLILMPGTSAPDARLALDRMCRTVEKTPFRAGDLEVPFTISIGLYSGMMQQDLTQQIHKADQNLYAAKVSGRNKVVG
jgi:diguanylate cyclase (GGDEF) domain